MLSSSKPYPHNGQNELKIKLEFKLEKSHAYDVTTNPMPFFAPHTWPRCICTTSSLLLQLTTSISYCIFSIVMITLQWVPDPKAGFT